jgi:DNA-binding GntR family transcriptional regulator
MKIESIADIAKRHIQEWIVTGQFLPGEQLKEEEISQRLDISRPPVREALKALEATGLVIRKPRRGVFVPEMTEKDMWEIYSLKATLYEMAMGAAMDVITEKEIERLESLVERMDACVKQEPFDVLKYQRLHRTFHMVIMEIGGNNRLKTIASHLHNQVTLFSYKTLQDREHLHSSLHYHWEILNAIKNKETSSACRLMKEHVLIALDVLYRSVGGEARPRNEL